MYKVDRQGKINEFGKKFKREFAKKAEKDICYKDKLKTTEVSLLYYILCLFFSYSDHFLRGRCINC